MTILQILNKLTNVKWCKFFSIRLVLYVFLIGFLFSCSINQKLKVDQCEVLSGIYQLDQKVRTDVGVCSLKYFDAIYPQLKGFRLSNFQKQSSMYGVLVRYGLNLNIDEAVKEVKRNIEFRYVSQKQKDTLISVLKTKTYISDLEKFLSEANILADSWSKTQKENKIKLKNFLNKYGYPSSSRFKEKCNAANKINYVFRHHSGDDELVKLIKKEYAKGRVTKKDCVSIFQYQILERNKKLRLN